MIPETNALSVLDAELKPEDERDIRELVEILARGVRRRLEGTAPAAVDPEQTERNLDGC